jgi:hypothetical protein
MPVDFDSTVGQHGRTVVEVHEDLLLALAAAVPSREVLSKDRKAFRLAEELLVRIETRSPQARTIIQAAQL